MLPSVSNDRAHQLEVYIENYLCQLSKKVVIVSNVLCACVLHVGSDRLHDESFILAL